MSLSGKLSVHIEYRMCACVCLIFYVFLSSFFISFKIPFWWLFFRVDPCVCVHLLPANRVDLLSIVVDFFIHLYIVFFSSPLSLSFSCSRVVNNYLVVHRKTKPHQPNCTQWRIEKRRKKQQNCKKMYVCLNGRQMQNIAAVFPYSHSHTNAIPQSLFCSNRKQQQQNKREIQNMNGFV